jgi:probable F420-dependent oxidoreductase
VTVRRGMTVPLADRPLPDHRSWFSELVDLGYTDLWSSEAAGADAFSPLLLAAAWDVPMRLGTAIVPVQTRGPAVLAQTAAALAEVAGSGFVLGVGASSPAIVQDWNARDHSDAYWRVNDTVRFLCDVFTGDKVTREYRTFAVRDFRLARPVDPPQMMVAALGPAMLRLAARTDGAILNWLGPGDVAAVLRDAEVAPAEVICRVMVCVNDDAEAVRAAARPLCAAYLSVPGYAQLYRRLGRAGELAKVWELWSSGRRREAAAAVPDSIVDSVVVHGDAEHCRARLQEYTAAGVTTPVLAPTPFGVRPEDTVRALGAIR